MSYNVFRIPKRNGKFRVIEEPDPELKSRQNSALADFEESSMMQPSEYAHAFIKDRSIVTMAENHVGKNFVGCCDIKDFFPSITREKLAMKIHSGVMSEHMDICVYDFGDGKGHRLPQGTPTSPYLSNIYLYDFDHTMARIANKYGVTYTRYADDLVFSGERRADIEYLINKSGQILRDIYDLQVHPKKTKIMHKSQRQMVCGVVVNEKLNTPREKRKNLRAEVHRQVMDGAEKLSRRTIGKQAFQNMVRRRNER